MSLAETFRKMGYRFISVNQEPKISQREALKKIHACLCSASVELGEPITVRSKFEQIKVDNYTDAQVNTILKGIKATLNACLVEVKKENDVLKGKFQLKLQTQRTGHVIPEAEIIPLVGECSRIGDAINTIQKIIPYGH